MHQLLLRQMRQLGLDASRPPNAQQWGAVLEQISSTYTSVDQDRDAVQPSLHISSDPTGDQSTNPNLSAKVQLQAVVHALPDLVIMFDEDGRCLEVLQGDGGSLQLPDSEVKDRFLAKTRTCAQSDKFLQAIQESLQTDTLQILEYDLGLPQDQRVFEARVIPTGLEVLGRRTVVLLARDVTDSVRSLRQLEHYATHDVLTGLPNRRLLDERLARAVLRAKRTGTSGAVLVLDLDQFKKINDRLGHSAGDQVLKAAGDRLRGTTRRQDTVVRLGGDEFVLIVEELPRADDAIRIAQQIIRVFAEPFALPTPSTGQTTTFHVTISIGIAVIPDDGEETADLLQQADKAMYLAKRAGGNRYACCHREAGNSSASDPRAQETRRRGPIGDWGSYPKTA